MRYGARPLIFMVILSSSGVSCTSSVAQSSAAVSQGPSNLAFDVASIRLNTSDSWAMSMSLQNGRLQVRNLLLKSLITSAYGVREGLIVGLPAWAEHNKYDIQAEVSDANPDSLRNLNQSQRRTLMRSLLEDRFHLRVHMEPRIETVMALRVDKGGIKFKESAVSGMSARSQGAVVPSIQVGSRRFKASDATMNNLCSFLAEKLDRSVIDETALSGRYDMNLTWVQDNPGVEEADDVGLMFYSLRQQLGLKLESTKASVMTLVVDAVEPPSEN